MSPRLVLIRCWCCSYLIGCCSSMLHTSCQVQSMIGRKMLELQLKRIGVFGAEETISSHLNFDERYKICQFLIFVGNLILQHLDVKCRTYNCCLCAFAFQYGLIMVMTSAFSTLVLLHLKGTLSGTFSIWFKSWLRRQYAVTLRRECFVDLHYMSSNVLFVSNWLNSRYGHRTAQGVLKDGWSSLVRYYLNNFADGTKQVGGFSFSVTTLVSANNVQL